MFLFLFVCFLLLVVLLFFVCFLSLNSWLTLLGSESRDFDFQVQHGTLYIRVSYRNSTPSVRPDPLTLRSNPLYPNGLCVGERDVRGSGPVHLGSLVSTPRHGTGDPVGDPLSTVASSRKPLNVQFHDLLRGPLSTLHKYRQNLFQTEDGVTHSLLPNVPLSIPKT